MNERHFTITDQLQFASLSGDYNPVHVDPVSARRTLFGKAVVHGVHQLLWGLEFILNGVSRPIRLISVRADFWKFVGIDEPSSCSWESIGNKTKIKISTNNLRTQITFIFEDDDKVKTTAIPASSADAVCKKNDPQDLSAMNGRMSFFLDKESLKKMFPRIFAQIPDWQIAAILATTRLVGMECPGLHSMFSRLKLSFESEPSDFFQWNVTSFDKKTKLVQIDLNAPGSINGEILAFDRETPVQQISFVESKNLVIPNEFAKERVLVIGGSRGLGEVSAKLLAAGGADVILTYAQGKEDAEKIVCEINEQNGKASSIQLNILDINSIRSVEKEWADNQPTMLCYFATPFIFSASPNLFSNQLFERFCQFYVTGFNQIAKTLIRLGVRKIFYPSSVAIEELPDNMGEYASAKIAGEMLCHFLEKSHPGTEVRFFRFPRMRTDQTQSISTVESYTPADICLRELRLLRDQKTT